MWWHPQTSGLKSLSIGSLALTPTFATGTKSYTAATSNATNKITAESLDEKDTITIKVNGTEIENGASATWTSGSNTVKVAVHDGYTGQDIEYTVTVTYTPAQ